MFSISNFSNAPQALLTESYRKGKRDGEDPGRNDQSVISSGIVRHAYARDQTQHDQDGGEVRERDCSNDGRNALICRAHGDLCCVGVIANRDLSPKEVRRKMRSK